MVDYETRSSEESQSSGTQQLLGGSTLPEGIANRIQPEPHERIDAVLPAKEESRGVRTQIDHISAEIKRRRAARSHDILGIAVLQYADRESKPKKSSFDGGRCSYPAWRSDRHAI
ncbi:MAG: hypothetical protein ABSG38_01220 [Spirochaetia bacterium]